MNFYFFIFMATLIVTEFEKGNATMMCIKNSESASSQFKISFKSEIERFSNKFTSEEEKYTGVKESLEDNLDSICMTNTEFKSFCHLAWKLCSEMEGEVQTVTYVRVYDTKAEEVNVDNNNQNLDQEVNFHSNDKTMDKYIQNLSVVGCTITLTTYHKFNFYITYFNAPRNDEFYMYYFKRSDNQLKFEKVQLYAYRVLLRTEIDEMYNDTSVNADNADNVFNGANEYEADGANLYE